MESAERTNRPGDSSARKGILPGLLLMSLCLAGSALAEQPPAVTLIAGEYAGAWESDSGDTGSSAVSIASNGSKLAGVMRIVDAESGYSGGEVTVVVQGDADGMLKLLITTRDSQFRGTAYFNGDQMFGEYQILAVKDRRQRSGGREVLDRGRFALVKRQQ